MKMKDYKNIFANGCLKTILLLLCLNVNAQNRHKSASTKTTTKKGIEVIEEKETNQKLNTGNTEARFFNSFVHSNTFNEFVLGGKQLTLKNVNFEIDEGTFALENKGVLFLIDGNKYGEIIFNGVSFKYLYNPLTKETRYQEVLAENNNFMIVKDYYLEIREIGGQGARSYAGSRGNKSYRKKFRYYLMMKDHFSEFKRKKSVVLDLLGEKANEIETYVEENDLSYKKDQDLKKIFKFYNSL